jgi:hypothetical protein
VKVLALNLFFKLLIPLCLLAGPCAAVALADGGTIRAVDDEGDFRIAVFTSPNPLRAGPVDLSVLVQNTETGQTVGNAHVAVRLTPRDRPRTAIYDIASSVVATNKLMQAALVELPAAGWWDVEVECTTDAGTTQTGFAMQALPPLPRWLTIWPWFTWPLAAVALFAIHRWLVGSNQNRAVPIVAAPAANMPVSSSSVGRSPQATV